MIQTIDIEGVSIAARINDGGFRDGRPGIVFIHGSGGDHSVWEAQFDDPALAGACNLAAVDLPGHGRSGGALPERVEDFARWTALLIGALGMDRPFVAGHSLGSAIALTLALGHGSSLAGVIPVGGGATMPVNEQILDGLRDAPAAVLPFVAKISVARENRPLLMDRLLADMGAVDPLVTRSDLIACSRFDVRSSLGDIDGPVLVVCGDDDKMMPLSFSRELADAIPGARLAVIEGAGHYPMMERPGAFNEALASFVGVTAAAGERGRR